MLPPPLTSPDSSETLLEPLCSAEPPFLHIHPREGPPPGLCSPQEPHLVPLRFPRTDSNTGLCPVTARSEEAEPSARLGTWQRAPAPLLTPAPSLPRSCLLGSGGQLAAFTAAASNSPGAPWILSTQHTEPSHLPLPTPPWTAGGREPGAGQGAPSRGLFLQGQVCAGNQVGSRMSW